jgi:hypothetical protein
MKTLFVLGAVAVLLLTGCVGVVIGRQSPPPAPTMPLNAADAATVAEIDAAARLTFDNQKLESLKQIAQRRELSPVAQLSLVDAGYSCLTFDNQKVDLLRAIIANPGFGDSARHAVVSQLNNLSFDNHRQEILRLINQRVSGL